MIIPVAPRPHQPLLLYTFFILAILPLNVLRKEKIKGPYELRYWGKLSVSSHAGQASPSAVGVRKELAQQDGSPCPTHFMTMGKRG